MIDISKIINTSRLSNLCTLIKGYIDNKVQVLADSIIDLDTAVDAKILAWQNVSVAVSAWSSNSTYSGYAYRAAITCSGVTTEYIPEVIFSAADATGGNFAPVADVAANTVYIYATTKPTAAITLPTIEARKAVKK